MVAKNFIFDLWIGKIMRAKRKKELFLPKTPTGVLKYEDLFDETLEEYEIQLSLQKKKLEPKEIRESIWSKLQKGLLTTRQMRFEIARGLV